jgi:hypothetical protein
VIFEICGVKNSAIILFILKTAGSAKLPIEKKTFNDKKDRVHLNNPGLHTMCR